MTSAFEYEQDAIHIRAHYVRDISSTVNREENHRKFSVDPNLTTYEILRTILSRAFELTQDDFRLNYLTLDQQRFPLLSDWDLDSAIISASDPFLQIEVVEHRPSTSSEYPESPLDELDDGCAFEIPNTGTEKVSPTTATSATSPSGGMLPSPEAIQSFVASSNQAGTSFILKHVNHTLPAITKRIHKAFTEDSATSSLSAFPSLPPKSRSPTKSPTTSTFAKPSRPALSDKEFRSFLDNVGELVSPRELRLVIYQGGVEPQLRKVVWKHLLGVYPSGLNGKERLEYMRQKSSEYNSLKDTWTEIFEKGKINSCNADGKTAREEAIEKLKRITNMVRKDVLRTDRQHKYFAGEGNENVTSLFNILTTYALNHPSVSYCQVRYKKIRQFWYLRF